MTGKLKIIKIGETRHLLKRYNEDEVHSKIKLYHQSDRQGIHPFGEVRRAKYKSIVQREAIHSYSFIHPIHYAD